MAKRIVLVVGVALSVQAAIPASPTPVDVVGGDAAPAMIDTVIPAWDPIVVMSRIEGDVHLRVEILPDGRIQDITATQSAHPLLTRLAAEAARGSAYTPACHDGHPTAGTLNLVYAFGNTTAECTDSTPEVCRALGPAPFLRELSPPAAPDDRYRHAGVLFQGDMPAAVWDSLRSHFEPARGPDEDLESVRGIALSTALNGRLLSREVLWDITARTQHTRPVFWFTHDGEGWKLTRLGMRPLPPER
ncbi:MAG: energy transducer TonB [Krumholzibacteria bacterium]|nr:energy transducer TonB [Candidatus Krumholzibacteria bacterium]